MRSAGQSAVRSVGKRTREPQQKRTQIGLVTPIEVANLPEKPKPATGDEEAGKAVVGPLGVEGGGACGRMSRGTWETQRLGGELNQTLAGNK
jgi:hypothetical protein